MTAGKITALVGMVVVFAVLALGSSQLLESLDAGEMMVVQSPIKGTLTWHITPGTKWQGFGKVTKYRKRDQFWFSAMPEQGRKDDESLRIRFNDGAHAMVSGSIAWELPMDVEHLSRLHSNYGSHAAAEHQLIRTVLEKAVYMTGPLMSRSRYQWA